MNSSHVAAGVGGSSLTAMLATVIQYWQGVQDVGVAAAEAGLLLILLGAAGAWLRWWLVGGALPGPIASGMNGGAKPPAPAPGGTTP